MGGFGHWLAVRDVEPSRLVELGCTDVRKRPAGWVTADCGTHEADPAARLRTIVGVRGIGLCASFYDSDFARIAFTAPTRGGEVLAGAEGAAAHGVATHSDWPGLAAWTAYAPRSLDVDQLRQILEADEIFVESSIERLATHLGLGDEPSPVAPRKLPYERGVNWGKVKLGAIVFAALLTLRVGFVLASEQFHHAHSASPAVRRADEVELPLVGAVIEHGARAAPIAECLAAAGYLPDASDAFSAQTPRRQRLFAACLRSRDVVTAREAATIRAGYG